ncbi:hypothetical protein B0O80DRAFT_437230 [Mortierella sp. GBAus27b]|nr:phospholipid scramblase 1 [Mortierella sp. GBA43]KAI8361298.1 hypothetical protein B0O80DRAFT_437230 [Mortierella sp. GBAus27b]
MSTLRKLQVYFFVFITIYMLTGIAAMVMGMVWLEQSSGGAPRDAVISRQIEKIGTIIGGSVAATTIVGFVGGVAPVRRKQVLIVFTWLIVVMMIAELMLGGVIWFKTLRMRSLFAEQWVTWPDSLRIAFQDMTTVRGYGQCCGYKYRQAAVAYGYCDGDTALAFPGCEEKVSAFADLYLRKLYTSLFGFTVVNVVCFLSVVALIQARNDEERYIRIGRKEGRMYKNSI